MWIQLKFVPGDMAAKSGYASNHAKPQRACLRGNEKGSYSNRTSLQKALQYSGVPQYSPELGIIEPDL